MSEYLPVVLLVLGASMVTGGVVGLVVYDRMQLVLLEHYDDTHKLIREVIDAYEKMLAKQSLAVTCNGGGSGIAASSANSRRGAMMT